MESASFGRIRREGGRRRVPPPRGHAAGGNGKDFPPPRLPPQVGDVSRKSSPESINREVLPIPGRASRPTMAPVKRTGDREPIGPQRRKERYADGASSGARPAGWSRVGRARGSEAGSSATGRRAGPGR